MLLCNPIPLSFCMHINDQWSMINNQWSMINGRQNETFTVLKDRVEKTTVSMHIHSYIYIIKQAGGGLVSKYSTLIRAILVVITGMMAKPMTNGNAEAPIDNEVTSPPSDKQYCCRRTGPGWPALATIDRRVGAAMINDYWNSSPFVISDRRV